MKDQEKFDPIKFLAKSLHKLVRGMSSEAYHGHRGTWSSSQLKDILDDEDLFIKKYIKREIERKEIEAFDTGTYFHTVVLEPHKVKSEIVVYDGGARYGKKWDAFKLANPGKTTITAAQKIQGDLIADAVRNSPVAMKYLVGEPEVSLFVHLEVYQGKIYSPKFGKVLTPGGWENGRVTNSKKAYQIVMKVRADCLGETFVSDLKSTSSNARQERSVRDSISKYKYDLSAALYLDMFALVRPSVREFIWIFASKSVQNAASWRATKNQILVGRAKYMRAILKLADCAMAKWELVDCLREAEPLPWEMEWIREKETDLL